MLASRAIERLHDLLRRLREGGSLDGECDLATEFADIAAVYQAGGQSVRERIRTAVGADECSALLALSGLCVDAALERRQVDLLRHSITAQTIEDFRLDPRENLRVLAIVWYGAEHLELEAKRFFEDCAVLGSSRGQTFLEQYARAPVWSKSLRTMGLEAIQEDGHVRFRTRESRPPR
jgi:hypothetical protein